jgi:hypothetical protein
MLSEIRGDAAKPRVLTPAEPRERNDGPLAIDPEMAKVLEKELKAKGDVTSILEERDRFSVFRLVAVAPSELLVEAVQIPKLDVGRWLESRISNSDW